MGRWGWGAVWAVVAVASAATYAELAIELEPGPGRPRAGASYASMEQALARLGLDCQMYPDMRASVVDVRSGERTAVDCVQVREGEPQWRAVPSQRAVPPGRFRVAGQGSDGAWHEAGSYLTEAAAREATQYRCLLREPPSLRAARMVDADNGRSWTVGCAGLREALGARGQP